MFGPWLERVVGLPAFGAFAFCTTSLPHNQMVIAMLSFLLSLLNPLGRLLKSIDNATDNETERQRIRAEIIQSHIRAVAETRQIAMQSRAFWIVWSLFAAPLGIWWALVLLDTSITAVSWGIPDLPPSVRPWADIIFGSIFGSGATVGAAQAIAGALRRK